MSTVKKTDNANLAAKLALRRYFLSKYHCGEQPRKPFFEGARVPDAAMPHIFDCCQGEGVIWRHLRTEFGIPSANYFGVDVKPKKGRLKIQSERVLQQFGWEFDVIDVDTYGSPWAHWNAILDNMSKPAATVFLTIGNVARMGASGMSDEMADALGLHFTKMKVKLSSGLFAGVTKHVIMFCLSRALDRYEIVECMEANPGPHARYMGIRIERKQPPAAF